MTPDQPGRVADWELLSERPGPSGYVTATTRRYRMPDGSTQEWDIVDSAPTVAVLAITQSQEVLLVRQFRPGPATILLEMPGGMVEPGETVLAAAARELLEETGYKGLLEPAGSCWLSARDTRRQHVAVARQSHLVAEPNLDDGEFCETVRVTLDQFRQLLHQGDMTDVGLGYRALDHLGLL